MKNFENLCSYLSGICGVVLLALSSFKPDDVRFQAQVLGWLMLIFAYVSRKK